MTTLYATHNMSDVGVTAGTKATLIREYDDEHMQCAIDVRLDCGKVLKHQHDLAWATSTTQWRVEVGGREYLVLYNPFAPSRRSGFLNVMRDTFGCTSADDWNTLDSTYLELDDELVAGLLSGNLDTVVEVI